LIRRGRSCGSVHCNHAPPATTAPQASPARLIVLKRDARATKSPRSPGVDAVVDNTRPVGMR
jgi:hypothetical protein